jgi:hypothetical protein
VSRGNKSSSRASAQVLNSPRAAPVSAGPEPFQREHEMCDALLRTVIAHSRYASRTDADRLGLIAHITILLAHEVAERVHNINGKDAARAFRKALARTGQRRD